MIYAFMLSDYLFCFKMFCLNFVIRMAPEVAAVERTGGYDFLVCFSFLPFMCSISFNTSKHCKKKNTKTVCSMTFKNHQKFA